MADSISPQPNSSDEIDQCQPPSYHESSATQPGGIVEKLTVTPKIKPAPISSTGDTLFAFAKDGRYLFATRAATTTVSTMIRAYTFKANLLQTLVIPRASRIYFHAFTPYEDELTAYQDSLTTKSVWQFTMEPGRPASAPSYKSLIYWLAARVDTADDMMQTKVTFGPGASYFVSCKGECIFHDLPQPLHSALLTKKNALNDPAGSSESWIPRIVALGVKDTFAAIWHDGTKLSHLPDDPGDRTLADLFIENPTLGNPPESITNLVLSHSNNDHWFLATEGGSVYWRLVAIPASIESIRIQGFVYVQLRAKENGESYREPNPVNGGFITVTPTSNYTWNDFKVMLDKKPPDKATKAKDAKVETLTPTPLEKSNVERKGSILSKMKSKLR